METKKTHALKHTFYIPVNLELNLERFVYSFVILGKTGTYLIDSGVSGSAALIAEFLNKNGRTLNDVKVLILTHSHPDHIGSANYIKENSGCKVLAHEAEKEWIENVEKQFAERPVPGFKNLVSESVKIDQFINDKDIIDLEEDLSIKVIHTPGHSKGSISLFIEKEGALFPGDSILLPGELPIYEDTADTINSVKKLLVLKNLKVLYSSWDAPVYGEDINRKMKQSINYLMTIHKAVASIDNAKELPPMELCGKVVNKMGLPPAAINPLIAKGFQSNLKLIEEGRDLLETE